VQALTGRSEGSCAVFEAPALVACLDNVAVVREAVEQRGGHFGITKNTRPLAEGEIRGDDDGRAFVEAADGVEQQLAAGLSERQIAELVEDDEVETGEEVGEPALTSGAALGLQTIDQVDGVEEAPARSAADTASGNGDRKVRFPGAGRSSVMVPGVWDQKCGSRIRIIHDVARRWRSWEANGTRAQATSLFASLMGRCLCSRVG
jgi:hypothetical protein